MPDTDIKGAKDVAEKMRKAVEWLDIPHDTSPVADVLTASFGLATTIAGSNQDLSNVNDLIARADLALYQAKEQGRNCIVLDGSPPI